MKRLLAVLSFALVAASCQEAQTVVPNPIAPSLERPPTPPLYPPESWTLTATVTSVTPHPCWRDLTGLTSEYKLIVHRAEPMHLSVYWDPTACAAEGERVSRSMFGLAGPPLPRPSEVRWFDQSLISSLRRVTLTGPPRDAARPRCQAFVAQASRPRRPVPAGRLASRDASGSRSRAT